MSRASTPGIYSELTKSIRTKAEETQQLQTRSQRVRAGKARPPPFNPITLARLLQENVTHAKCCHAKARNVAGYGFELKPHPHVDDANESQREIAREFWFGEDSTWVVDPDLQQQSTPGDVLEVAWLDFEAIGWLSLEKLTAMDGTPTGLAWVPAMSSRKIRTHNKEGEKVGHGYVQTIDNEDRYFGVAGDQYADEPIFVDQYTGAFGSEVDNPANELIWKQNKSLLHPHYGTTDIIPGRRALQGKKEAELFNVEFFENDGVPRLAVIVEGGQLTDRASDQIEELLTESKDGSSHRTLFLEVEKVASDPQSIDLSDGAEPQDVEIRIEPLTVNMEEDASFLDYQDSTEHDILQAHEVPPVVAGVLKSGAFSTDTNEQRKEFADSVVGPKQEAFSTILYETIHKPLGVTDWIVDFKTRGLENREQEVDIAAKKIEALQGAVPLEAAYEWLGLDSDILPDEFQSMLLSEVIAPQSSDMAPIEAAVDDLREEAREEGERQGRVEYMIENSPEE